MAETSVFTNSNSSGSGDLLQQAFQQVVDDEDQENELVAFLQSDGGNSQVIQLTAEQAAALGITFKIDDEQPAEQTNGNFHECGATEQPQQQHQQTLSPEESQRIINELTQSGLLKHDGNGVCTLDDWSVQ